MPETFLTSVGRIVWGNPAVATQKKNMQTKQVEMKEGQPVMQWSFGVAFPKNEFLSYVKPYLDREAATIFPNGVPSNFAWKYKDGDGIDGAGKPYSSREGYAGCYVLNISTEAYAPPIFKFENGAYRQIAANEIKTGDYIAINLNIKANKPAQAHLTPSLYINPNGIELVGYGNEIITTTDPNDMFGGQQKHLPSGASAVPTSSAPANTQMPGTPPTSAPVQQYNQPPAQTYGQPAAAPVQQYNQPPAQTYGQPAAQPGQLPPPAHDFVQNAGQTNYNQPPAQNYNQPAAAPAQQYNQPAGQQPMQGLPQGR